MGIKVSKDLITSCIKKVMDFFFVGKSFKGKLFSKKAAAKVIYKKRRQLINSDIMDKVSNFCDQRGEESPMVVSCDENVSKELSDVMVEPYLFISSSDLNSCNFSKSLGNLLLEDRPNLFLETSNLLKTGKERLEKIVTDINNLFDNRLRVFLYGKPTVEELAEKRFLSCEEDHSSDHDFYNDSSVLEPPYQQESLLS